MATRAIRPKREDGPLGGNWQPIPERAPSIIRTDRPVVARILAMFAVILVSVGGLAMIMAGLGKGYVIGPDWGFVWFSLGVMALLFHAFRDSETQYRRVYSSAGFLLLIVGIGLRAYPVKGVWGALFLPYGVPGLAVGALFLIAVVRNETEAWWRLYVLRVLGILGAVMLLAGLVGGNSSQAYLEAEGTVLLFLGLLYVGAYIGLQEPDSHEGYWGGLALGIAGAAGFALALLRSILAEGFLVPAGFVLMTACVLYLIIALGTCSESKLVVLTRRELSALFYSPIAYFVLFAMVIVGWIRFIDFLDILAVVGPRGVEEPFVRYFFFHIFPVVTVMIIIPVLTMGLLSEEKRSATLEVLLTAPVNEWSIVLSKFVAVLLFYLVALLPWGLFFLALRVLTGEVFEYRPLLSFVIALIFTGASCLSVGLFFSSVTRNQIVAAVLGFAFMLAYTFTSQFFIRTTEQPWASIVRYVSYLDLWWNSLGGQLAPRFLLFHFSFAFFFLFLTTKILEARKWT